MKSEYKVTIEDRGKRDFQSSYNRRFNVLVRATDPSTYPKSIDVKSNFKWYALQTIRHRIKVARKENKKLNRAKTTNHTIRL